jgi:hypothetical protein
MKYKNTDLVDEIRSVIWITEKSKTNDEVNILKKSNQRTGAPTPKLKELLDRHAGKYWNATSSESSGTKFYTNRLTLRMPDDYIPFEEE